MNRKKFRFCWWFSFFICSLWVLPVSCAQMERRLEGRMKPPGTPADTAVYMRAASTGKPAEGGNGMMPAGPLRITLTDAVLLGLENNRFLVAEKLSPAIRQTFEDQERALFDPVLSADVSVGKEKREARTDSDTEIETATTDTLAGGIFLEKYFPTGTTLILGAGTRKTDASFYEDPVYASRLGMTVTQALLKGYGTGVNLARVRQARLETRMSEYELRGFVASLVADVERTYWDYALARRQIEIVEESLKVARQQLDETRELIDVGRLAKAELAAVQAEVATQEQALIDARTTKESIRLKLLRLLNPSVSDMWDRQIELVHQPSLPGVRMEAVSQHVAVSMRMRPVLNEARLELLHGNLELVKTRNGLLPLMDLFVSLGKSGYADSFGGSISDITDDHYDALAGVRFRYPLVNRNAEALHRRTLLSRDQAQKALDNLLQLVEVDVRTAYIEVDRTHQQIAASSVTRRFNEEKLRIETEKLRVGKSTSFLVAQAQRDLLASRIAEVQALTQYLKALTTLYLQDGSLLERRGIAASGRKPVDLEAR